MNPIIEAFYIAYLGDARKIAEIDDDLYWMATKIENDAKIRRQLLEQLGIKDE